MVSGEMVEVEDKVNEGVKPSEKDFSSSKEREGEISKAGNKGTEEEPTAKEQSETKTLQEVQEEEQSKTVEVPVEPTVGATEKPGGPLEVLPDKETEIEGIEVEATTDVNEPVKEPEESGLEVKDRENVDTSVNKLEEEKSEEIAKSNIQNQEFSSKNGNETKTSKDLPKEVLGKPIQKRSNNFISKIKQSLVKAKKSIIGKFPSSKTFSSETKGDVKVK